MNRILTENSILNKLKELTFSTSTQEIYVLLNNLDKKEKGNILEHYLEFLYKGQGWIVKINNITNYDFGADLLLIHPDTNEITNIVQIKNHIKPLDITKTRNEIRRFEDESRKEYKCNNFILIALNGYSTRSYNIYSQFSCRLESWSYIEELIRNYNIQHKKPLIELNNYNNMAYNNALALLEKHDKACVVQATGTGKSYIIAKLLCELHCVQKLVLAPTIFILNQIKNIIPWTQENTIFMTYSEALELTKKENLNLNLTILILDEFHRAGAKEWSKAVNEIINTFKNIKIFGTTATHFRYLEGRDMAAELFESKIANNLELSDAIAKKILPPPVYVAAIYNLETVTNNFINKINATELIESEKNYNIENLKRFLIDFEKANGIPHILKKYINVSNNKFIVFCEDKNHLLQSEWLVKSWFQKTNIYKRIETVSVYYDNPNNEENLQYFKDASQKETLYLLFSINQLSEGVHMDDLAGVMLLRSTKSPNLYMQQIGRAFNTNNKNSPIIFDFVNNYESISSKFIDAINSSIITENIQRTKAELSPINIEFLIEDYTVEVQQLFKTIEENLYPKWHNQFLRLLKYKNKFGHCLVPITYSENPTLANWVNVQRTAYNKNQLSQSRIDKLDEIGFVWNPHDHNWFIMYNDLILFKLQYGHCLVPDGYNEHPKLSNWIRVQRSSYKKGTLDDEKFKMLNNIEFVWDVLEHNWNVMYLKLITAMENINIVKLNPFIKFSNEDINKWMKNQRTYYRGQKLSPDKITKLNNIGFVWDILETQWMFMYNELKDYKNKTGSIQIPKESQSHPNRPKLYNWIMVQRGSWKKGTLSEEQIDLLNQLGFLFNPYEEYWFSSYAKLVTYYNCYGDTLVPKNSESDSELAAWVGTQRSLFKLGKLSPHKIRLLNKINFIWNVNDYLWDMKYEEYKKFITEFGLFKVPRGGEYHSLAMWVKKQKAKIKNGFLDDDKLLRLKAIGFVIN